MSCWHDSLGKAMARPGQILTRLAELERSYDGPVPARLRRLAYFGSAAHLRLAEAESEAEFFKTLIGDQLEAVRRWRKIGSVPNEIVRDLALYRRRRYWWRGEAVQLRAKLAAIPMPSAGDVP
jgi:hypothetical protein